MHNYEQFWSLFKCSFMHIFAQYVCVWEREKGREMTHMSSIFNAFFYVIPINQISLIHTEKLFISKTSNYMTALMAQPFIFTFFLAQYMYSSFSTSQQDTSSSNPKCKCQKPISCVSLLFLFDEHQFWFTTLVCVRVCHIPNVGDAS